MQGQAGSTNCRGRLAHQLLQYLIQDLILSAETSHPHGPPIGLQPSEPPSAGLLRITTQPPKSLDTLYGSVATLSCRARGWLPDQVITYQWYKDGTTVPSDNTGDLRISTVTCADQGQYQCVASCGNITAESDPVNLHVELGKLSASCCASTIV